MNTISYQIEFYSYWHCGSGLAAGADVDALAIKDDAGIPFIPGKTIKGLVREAAEEIGISDAQATCLFGNPRTHAAETFFTDAILAGHDEIVAGKLGKHLFVSVASTMIDEDGIAFSGSLRKTEVVIPCVLYGKIVGVRAEDTELITIALQFIKVIGVGRNRGLGRCKISFIKEGKI